MSETLSLHSKFDTQSVAPVAERELAATAPTIDQGKPDKVLSLVVRGDWGHFRRIDRTVTKQTYRIMPKTTIAGMLAAIVGAPRDSYYDVFSPSQSAIAIAPIGELRTMTLSSLGVWTNMDERQRKAGASSQSYSATVRWPNTTTDRQRHPYEYLVNPMYRIDVAVESEQFYRTLAARLASNTSCFTPALGLSELLASVEFIGEQPVSSVDSDESTTPVYSIVPDGMEAAVPKSGVTYHVERTPHAMSVDDGGRKTTSFADYTYTMTHTEAERETTEWTGSTDQPLTAPVTLPDEELNSQCGVVNGRTVAFF